MIDAFIQRWKLSGAAERANYQLFLSELCAVLDVEAPQPARAGVDQTTISKLISRDKMPAAGIARTLTYDCAVRWNGRAPTNALLTVWFVGIPATGGKDMILDNKVFELTLNPASNCLTRVTSESIDHSKTDYVALGLKERDGAKLRGCVVQLIIADDVARAYASLGHLKDAAWKCPFGDPETGTIGAKD